MDDSGHSQRDPTKQFYEPDGFSVSQESKDFFTSSEDNRIFVWDVDSGTREISRDSDYRAHLKPS